MSIIKIGEYKKIAANRYLINGRFIFRGYFKCDFCRKEFLFAGKGRRQFVKRLYAKGCRVFNGKSYCHQCRRRFLK